MNRLHGAWLALSLAAAAPVTQAGVYADDLGKCLVSSTSDADRALMVKWMFAAMSLNSQVASFVNMPTEVRDQLNRDTAQLYLRLMTEKCRTQTRDAANYEGGTAIEAAFRLPGQVAALEMFKDPAVQQGMGSLEKSFDQDKLKAVLEEK